MMEYAQYKIITLMRMDSDCPIKAFEAKTTSFLEAKGIINANKTITGVQSIFVYKNNEFIKHVKIFKNRKG
jgi:hypothetical protein